MFGDDFKWQMRKVMLIRDLYIPHDKSPSDIYLERMEGCWCNPTFNNSVFLGGGSSCGAAATASFVTKSWTGTHTILPRFFFVLGCGYSF